MSTCLVPRWDLYRFRCGMGTKGVCGRHGPHQPHPDDGRPCEPQADGYCGTHGVYMDPATGWPRVKVQWPRRSGDGRLDTLGHEIQRHAALDFLAGLLDGLCEEFGMNPNTTWREPHNADEPSAIVSVAAMMNATIIHHMVLAKEADDPTLSVLRRRVRERAEVARRNGALIRETLQAHLPNLAPTEDDDLL